MAENQNINLVLDLLSHDTYRQYNVVLAKRLGGIEYAILLNDLLDQYKYLLRSNQLVSHATHGDGLMYYTQNQAYERCGINKDSFETGLKIFVELGFIVHICKFGMPQKRYLKLDISAIYGWAFSNNVCRVRKSANKLAETRKHVSGNPLRNDKENDSYSIPNNRLCDPPPPKPIPKKSPSLKKHEAVSFDPFSYKLKDGSPLQEITAKSFAKKMKDPKQAFLILSNVEWYEKQVEKGIKPKSSHERFLQFAISNDLASKENIIANNDLYAQFVKDEHKLNGIKILKTLVQLDKKNGSKPESISKNLPEITFSNIIDNYVKHMKLKE